MTNKSAAKSFEDLDEDPNENGERYEDGRSGPPTIDVIDSHLYDLLDLKDKTATDEPAILDAQYVDGVASRSIRQQDYIEMNGFPDGEF